MTHFVAAWAPPGSVLRPGLTEELARALAPAGSVRSIALPRAAAAFWDSELWPGDLPHIAEGQKIVLAGDPVLVDGDAIVGRAQAARHISERLFGDPQTLLRRAEGSYALLAISDDGSMLAATDKLGVRPVYWTQTKGFVVVSSALWVLSRLAEVPKAPDLRGVIETCAFGAPLADRTVFSSVHALGAGEYLELTGYVPVIRRYWDWTSLPPSRVTESDLALYITEAFNRAVDARLREQQRVFSFLSGGMDSRLVGARLRSRGVDVCGMNFAPPGSQDHLFGRMAAGAMGARLFEFHDQGTDFLDRRDQAFEAWRKEPRHAGLLPPEDRLIWSGDGGSVALGHVYLTEEIVRCARMSNIDATARLIQRTNRYEVSPRSFAKRYRDLAAWPLEAIKEDLRSREAVEPGRNAHLFFMLNDQRRHLALHYERLHLHRLDLVLPFFDGRFLAAVLSSPIDPFLLHRLYNAVMAKQPFGLGKVPWQAYPGHEPCPVAISDGGRQQWGDGWFDRGTRLRSLRRQMRGSLRFALSQRFPSRILNRPALIGAAAVGALGMQRYTYLLKPIEPLCEAMGMT